MSKTSGQLLAEALAQPGDSTIVTQLIERAGKFRDMIDRLTRLIEGEESAWMNVRINDDVLEVNIANPVKESKNLTTEFRQLLAEINRQRSGSAAPTSNVNVLDDDDD